MVDCIWCGAPGSRLLSCKQKSDGLNVHGRREITFEALHEDIVTWDPAASLYRCAKCGGSFTFTQATTGAPAPKQKKDPQRRLA